MQITQNTRHLREAQIAHAKVMQTYLHELALCCLNDDVDGVKAFKSLIHDLEVNIFNTSKQILQLKE